VLALTPRTSAAESVSVLSGRPACARTVPALLRPITTPLRTFGSGARIATTVRAGGKANLSNAKGLGAIWAAVALLFAFGVLLPVRAGHLETSRVKMLRADESYNGRTVKLAAGEFLEISLAENPTTGYRWRLLEAATVTANCPLVKDSYEPGHPQVAGQGGIHRWQFQAAEPGACTIELEYRRSWQKDKPPERTFRIHVEVRKGVQASDPAKPSG
jgi:predicted secreted protein